MPSPFPGMDPFIESQWWRDFHHRFIPELADRLLPAIRPRYVAIIEEHVYLAHDSGDNDNLRIPDVSVFQTEEEAARPVAATEIEETVTEETTTMIAPAVRTLSLPESTREIYLTIRERQSLRVVTVIELLSPTNKQGKGRLEYLRKRTEILESRSHLVELDLLRGGLRLPTTEPLPPGDYFAFVCRQERLPDADVYAWPLRHRLPPVPIPLAEDDPEVILDLQHAFTAVYDRAGYDLLLDYEGEVKPALQPNDATWVQDALTSKNDRRSPRGDGP